MTTAVAIKARVSARAKVVSCTACALRTGARAPVPFSGPTPNPIAILGEAPGNREDRDGLPFIGPAGQLLREVLTNAGFDPSTLTYFNTVSCWPHGTPDVSHREACAPNVSAQLSAISPSYLLVTGKTALSVFRPDLDIGKAEGNSFVPYPGLTVMVAFHPAAVLRNAGLYGPFSHAVRNFRRLTLGEWTGRVTCVECATICHRYDPDGLPWCERHFTKAMTGYERAATQRAALYDLPF